MPKPFRRAEYFKRYYAELLSGWTTAIRQQNKAIRRKNRLIKRLRASSAPPAGSATTHQIQIGMSHYSQGCADDGPCILMDGKPMTPDQIVEKLNDLESALRTSPTVESVAAEAYQVIGCLSHTMGVFDKPGAIKALDYFGDIANGWSQVRVKSILPWNLESR